LIFAWSSIYYTYSLVRELHAEFLVDAFFSIDVVFDHQRPGQNIIRHGGGICNQGMEEEYTERKIQDPSRQPP
jgi:hypothetical protein